MLDNLVVMVVTRWMTYLTLGVGIELIEDRLLMSEVILGVIPAEDNRLELLTIESIRKLDIKDNGIGITDTRNGFEKGKDILARIYVDVAADQEVVKE